MPTRILFDPRVDLPDGSTTSSPVIVEATPTGIRANGAVVVLPSTITFTIASPTDVLQLATPAASWGWRLVVRRQGSTRYGAVRAEVGSILQTRTVTWADAPTIAWTALTDLDLATLAVTPATVTAWQATAALAQSALDAVNALKAGAPGALDTFLELATQLQADESGAAALATLVAGKADAASVAATYPALRSTPPDPAVVVAYVDTSTVPPTLKGWNGTAWVAIGGSAPAPDVTTVDNTDGTFAVTGATVTDLGDGTFTSTGSVTDNGDGTFTLAA